MTIREQALKDIAVERLKQDAQWGGDPHDDLHSGADWVALVTRYASDSLPLPSCREISGREEFLQFRKRMVQAAALAMAAVEWAERSVRVLPGEEEVAEGEPQ